jgi:hypothetical protein
LSSLLLSSVRGCEKRKGEKEKERELGSPAMEPVIGP